MLRLSMIAVIALGAAVQSCGPRAGYQRVDGRWAWVAAAASFSQRVQPLDADDATFAVLVGGRYAHDARTVFYDGARIVGADPATLEAFDGHYARDRHRAYIASHVVRGADASTFQPLALPYSRDARGVYYGSIPMDVSDPDAFRVVRPSGGIAVTPVRTLGELDGALADTLLARGYAPDDVVVIGAAVSPGPGAGRAGDQRYEGALPLP